MRRWTVGLLILAAGCATTPEEQAAKEQRTAQAYHDRCAAMGAVTQDQFFNCRLAPTSRHCPFRSLWAKDASGWRCIDGWQSTASATIRELHNHASRRWHPNDLLLSTDDNQAGSRRLRNCRRRDRRRPARMVALYDQERMADLAIPPAMRHRDGSNRSDCVASG